MTEGSFFIFHCTRYRYNRTFGLTTQSGTLLIEDGSRFGYGVRRSSWLTRFSIRTTNLQDFVAVHHCATSKCEATQNCRRSLAHTSYRCSKNLWSKRIFTNFCSTVEGRRSDLNFIGSRFHRVFNRSNNWNHNLYCSSSFRQAP